MTIEAFLVESTSQSIYAKKMKHSDSDETDRPASSGLFPATHWSIVLRAKEKSFSALDNLFNQYRDPMIRFLIIRSRTREQAEDLVHGFCAKLLNPDKKYFLSNVSPQKGKFRSFLLTSLKNYIGDEIDKGSTSKRGDGIAPSSLDEVDSDNKPIHSPSSSTPSAELEFDRAWAQTILRNSLKKLEKGYSARDRSTLYIALEPMLHEDETSLSYRKIATQLDMTEGAVKAEAKRMRDKVQEIIRDELMQTVSNEDEFNEELAYLKSVFGRTHI